MAQPPTSQLFQTQNYPAENKPLLDLLLPQLQTQFDQLRSNLAGGLTRSNTAGQDLQVSVATPASDWIPIQLTAGFGTGGATPGFTSIQANLNGFSSPRFRYGQGCLFLDGACEYSANGTSGPCGTGTIAIPANITNSGGTGGSFSNLPITLPSGGVGNNVDISGCWAEINTTGVQNAVSYANAALIRYVASQGQLQLRAAGTAAPASPWGVTFLSLTCQIPTPGLVVPPLSCFPIPNIATTVTNPSRVTISYILDNTTPKPALVAVSPGGLYWTAGAPGTITVQNISGLALGRQYLIGLFVEP